VFVKEIKQIGQIKKFHHQPGLYLTRLADMTDLP